MMSQIPRPQKSGPDGGPKNTENNKSFYRSFISEVFNEGRVDKLGDYVSSSYRLRDAPTGTPSGPESVAAIVRQFRAAFPDLNITVEEQVAEGDIVCSRTVTRGTHEGPLFGLQPTHKRIAVSGLTMVRIVARRITESTVKNDMIALLKQLGATALPG
jgi:predicted ester cyclase